MSTALVVWRKNYIKARKVKPIRTICEVLREMHRDAEAKGDALLLSRIDECYDMAKRMQRRLEVLKPGAPYIVSGGGHAERQSKAG